MTLTEVLTIFLSSILVNNVVTHFGFGNIALGENAKSEKFLIYSCIMFSVGLILSCIGTYFANTYFLIPNDLSDFCVIAEVAISTFCVFIMGIFVYKKSKANYFVLKNNTYIVTFVAAIVGATIFVMTYANGISQVILYAVGSCIGFVLINTILVSFSGYARRNVEGFTPYIINILSIAVISLIVMSLSSLV